jgi:cyclase
MVIRDFARFRALVERFPGRIVPALDILGETVRVDGWREEADDWRVVAERLVGLPCPAVLATDISRDGVLGGPNFGLTIEVARVSGLPALVSGGVACLADVAEAARRPEIGGVVLGKALYEGAIDLGQALAIAGGTDLTARIIPCLDVDAGRVVKGIRFLELQDMGDPAEAARRYADQGADELVFLDVSATFEDRDTRRDWVGAVATEVFVPLTVGGGVRSVEDARLLLRAGADKVAVNSAAVARPELLTELANQFGRQCVVLSIDARRRPNPDVGWEVCTHGGRRGTGLDVVEWAERGVQLGAGEILLTSMDGDGTKSGYDLELMRRVTSTVAVPVIASGGAGNIEHLAQALEAGAAAVLAASIFHLGEVTVGEVKRELESRGFAMREVVGA